MENLLVPTLISQTSRTMRRKLQLKISKSAEIGITWKLILEFIETYYKYRNQQSSRLGLRLSHYQRKISAVEKC